jgi:hypothetical protein
MMTLQIFAALLIALSGYAAAQEPPKPAAEPKPPAKAPAEPVTTAQGERVLQVEKSTKPPECVIKPVRSDEELRACGARIAK